MAKSRLSGVPARRPGWTTYIDVANAPATINPTVIDAANERHILYGLVQWSDGGTHDIASVHWRCGTAGGTVNYTLRVSLRDPDFTTSTPGRDDGVVDQFATHVNPTAATNFTSTLDSARAGVAHGDYLCVVFDFSAWTSGTFAPTCYQMGTNTRKAWVPGVSHFDGVSTYTEQSAVPMITFEASDGTIGQFFGGLPRGTITTLSFNNTSAQRRVALEFSVGHNLWAGVMAFMANNWGTTYAPFSLHFMQGATDLFTKAFDPQVMHSVNASRFAEAPFADIALTSGNTYRVAIEPTSNVNIQVQYLDVSTASHLDTLAPNHAYATYDGSSWAAPTTTRIPFAFWGIAAVEDGAGGGGGGAGVPLSRVRLGR